jgi:DNA-binding MarR family transcriptional regulator
MMSDCPHDYGSTVVDDPAIAEIADRLFELVLQFRPPRPLHRARDGDREEQEQHRQRHGQMRLLITLFHEGPLTGQDLARALDVSAPTASVLAKKAFEEGWIERRRDQVDSRIVWLELAPSGRERVRAHRAERVRKLERMIARRTDLDRAEIARAIDVLTRLFSPEPGTNGEHREDGGHAAPDLAGTTTGEGRP